MRRLIQPATAGRNPPALAADHDDGVAQTGKRVHAVTLQIAAQDRRRRRELGGRGEDIGQVDRMHAHTCERTHARVDHLLVRTGPRSRARVARARSPNQSAMRSSVPTLPASWTPSRASVNRARVRRARVAARSIRPDRQHAGRRRKVTRALHFAGRNLGSASFAHLRILVQPIRGGVQFDEREIRGEQLTDDLLAFDHEKAE
jgi:hypothetical protein